MKTPDYQQVYFVAAKAIEKTTGYVDIGVWSMGGEKNNPNMTFSINDHAKNISHCGLGKATMADKGALDLKYYVERLKN